MIHTTERVNPKLLRISKDPIFNAGEDSPTLRILALAHAPAAFKRRNIFTSSVDLPLRLRAGRPTKSLDEKRKNNAERQCRFRRARLEELAALRKQVAKKYPLRKIG